MNDLRVLSAIVVLTAALPAAAAERCSIHPPKGLPDNQLTSLAKVSQAEAEKVAVARLHEKGAVSVASAELEAEHGCLIWSFDVRYRGLAKNLHRLEVTAALTNIYMVRRELLKA